MVIANPLRRPLLEPGEVAFFPDWGSFREVLAHLAESKAKWRIDPIFQFVAVTGPAAESLAELGLEDASGAVHELAEKNNGARIIACDRFAGMLVYNFEDRLVYHIDARDFAATPLLDESVVAHFPGLGKAAVYDLSLDFASVEDATSAFATHAKRAQLKWLKEQNPSSPSKARRRPQTKATNRKVTTRAVRAKTRAHATRATKRTKPRGVRKPAVRS